MVYVNTKYADRLLRSDSEAWLMENSFPLAKEAMNEAKKILEEARFDQDPDQEENRLLFVVVAQSLEGRSVNRAYEHTDRQKADIHLSLLKKQGWKAELWLVRESQIQAFTVEKRLTVEAE